MLGIGNDNVIFQHYVQRTQGLLYVFSSMQISAAGYQCASRVVVCQYHFCSSTAYRYSGNDTLITYAAVSAAYTYSIPAQQLISTIEAQH